MNDKDKVVWSSLVALLKFNEDEEYDDTDKSILEVIEDLKEELKNKGVEVDVD